MESLQLNWVTRALNEDNSQTCLCVDDPAQGTALEKTFFIAVSWVVLGVCIVSLAFYGYHLFKATCGWEELYVCVIEAIKITLDIFAVTAAPCTLIQLNGVHTSWLRYSKWLLTCPVILMHLSNLTGLKDACSHQTMALLVANMGGLVMAITAALSSGFLKPMFYAVGVIYCAYSYWLAAKIYIEAYCTMPEGACKKLVKFMAYLFYISWTSFPLLFALGPEGFGVLSYYTSDALHSFMDLFAKNLWGLCGHTLRIKFHEFILIHGNIRKETIIDVVGEKLVIEEFKAEEDIQHGAYRCSSAGYVGRRSFMRMRSNLKHKGKEVRMSLDGTEEDTFDSELGYVSSLAGGARIRPTRRSLAGDASRATSVGGAGGYNSRSMGGGRSLAGTAGGHSMNHRSMSGRPRQVNFADSGGGAPDNEVTAVVTTAIDEEGKGAKGSNNKVVPL